MANLPRQLLIPVHTSLPSARPVAAASRLVFPAGRVAAVIVAAGLVASRPVAAAERQGVAVAPLRFVGELPEAAREILTARLNEGLQRAGISIKETAAEAPGDGCNDSPCYRALASRLGVAYVITARVETAEKNYDFDLEIVNGRSGQPNGAHHQRCQICGITEAGERMSLAASVLAGRLNALTKEPAHILIRSNPDGADVSIDGERRGISPIEVNLPAGSHQVTLSALGHRPLERSINVVGGVDHALDLDLLPNRSGFAYRTAGWTSLGTGAVLLVTGVILLLKHGSDVGCADALKDREGDCPKVINTNYWAAGLLTAGAAAATLGSTWLYLGRDSSPAGDAGNRVDVVAGLRGRF